MHTVKALFDFTTRHRKAEHMALLSLREAEKRFDVTRPTLTKALNNGKISGTKNDKGHWTIDHAELARVYTPRPLPDEQESGTDDFTTQNTGKNAQSTLELVKAHQDIEEKLRALEQELAVAKALAAERGRILDQMMKLIPDQRANSPWWKGPFGKK